MLISAKELSMILLLGFVNPTLILCLWLFMLILLGYLCVRYSELRDRMIQSWEDEDEWKWKEIDRKNHEQLLRSLKK